MQVFLDHSSLIFAIGEYMQFLNYVLGILTCS